MGSLCAWAVCLGMLALAHCCGGLATILTDWEGAVHLVGVIVLQSMTVQSLPMSFGVSAHGMLWCLGLWLYW